MHRAIYYLMLVLMLLWTAALLIDIGQGLLVGQAIPPAAPTQSPVETAQGVYRSLTADLWTPAAQTRAIVWGIPMTVFSLIAAISQR